VTPPARRVGVYGGSFDPPHLAHLALARVARDALALDELRLLPAGQPWQKTGRALAPAADREAMLRLLVGAEAGMAVDRRELLRQGASYTVDTLRELAAEQPGAELFLVIGADQFVALDTWHEPQDILRLATLAVAARAGVPPRPPAAWAARDLHWREIPLPRHDATSTEVRRRIAAGEPFAPLVGDAVAGYIDQHQLYRAAPGP
jgi:nicotinate-nucleotide adenylyltransferase